MPKVPQPWLVQYLDGSGFIDPQQPLDPGFTKILQDTVGDVGGPSDGFDQIVSEVFGLIDALDAASAEQDAVLDAILAQHQDIDTTPLDSTIENYVGTIPTGDGILASAAGASPPFLGVMPLSIDPTAAGIPMPPALTSFDFGTVKLGSPPVTYDVGKGEQSSTGSSGVSNILILANTGMDIFIQVDEKDSASGDIARYHYYLVVTPSQVGTFNAEVTWMNTVQPVQTNLTLTINVVP